MNKQKFLRNLAIVFVLVLVAGLFGQLRRMSSDENSSLLVVRPSSNTAARARACRALFEPRQEVIVRFRDNVSRNQIDELTGEFNDTVEDRYELESGLTAITDNDGLSAEEVAAEYRDLADVVEYAEPVQIIRLDPVEERTLSTNMRFAQTEAEWREIEEAMRQTEREMNTIAGDTEVVQTLAPAHPHDNVPNDPKFGEQWALSNTGQREGKAKADISALEAWKRTKGSEDVVIAVLDSGVNYVHPDLAENIWQRPANIAEYKDAELGTIDDLHGYNAAENSGDPMDDNGHGSHCAGIIGAVGGNSIGIAGINWHVKIMPLKFMSRGGFGTTKDAIEAINYVVERKKAGVNVRIISASWGSTSRSKALEDAIRKAGEAGILFVAASGNSSVDTDRSPHFPANYALPNVMSVAALDRNDALASFSNYGAKTVHIAAPGREILSTWLDENYFEASGTSMATPYVAGVAALVLSVDNDLTVKELRERLLTTVDKLSALNGKIVSGGRVNAARAVAGK